MDSAGASSQCRVQPEQVYKKPEPEFPHWNSGSYNPDRNLNMQFLAKIAMAEPSILVAKAGSFGHVASARSFSQQNS